MKDLNHENVTHLLGATFDNNNALVLVWLHTGRRCLEQTLFNDDIQLNMMFKASIVRDLVKVKTKVCILVCFINRAQTVLEIFLSYMNHSMIEGALLQVNDPN